MSNTAFLTVAGAKRWDLYGPIHKGLRLAHSQMLIRLGQADFTHDQSALMADLRTHLALGAKHLAHEDRHIHPALERRAPGAAVALEAQHGHHRRRFAELERSMAKFEGASIPERAARGRALYISFVALVAEDFEHMAEEETVVWPQLCALFDDAELAQIEMDIIAALAPDEVIAFMRMMIPAMAPAERASLLGGLKANAPAEAFAAVIERAARPTLSTADFDVLERLGLAA
ncbi:hypothetical protein [Caulobacter sp. LARHSG274]